MTDLLLHQGHAVTATDVCFEDLERLAWERQWPTERTLLMPLDVRQPADWKRAIAQSMARWGRLDVGMNIAGVIRPGYLTEQTPADVDWMVDVNLKGVMLGTCALAEVMLQQGGGHIVNVASLAGIAPIRGLSIYSATKCAVRAYSIATALELRQKNVFLSVVCPDLVDTNMLTLQLEYEAAALTFSGNRILTVEDVGRAIMKEALAKKRLEVLLPGSRGWLGKLGNAFPALATRLTESLSRKGLTNQQQLKERNQR